MKKLPPLRYIILTIVLVTLAILFSFSNIMQEIIAPFLYLLVLRIATILDALPPLAIWILFVIGIFQFSLTNLFTFSNKILDNRAAEPEISEDQLGPVEKYGKWVSQSGQGEYFQNRISQHMSKLTRQTLDIQAPRWEWIQILKENELNLDPTIQNFLLEGQKKSDSKVDLSTRFNLSDEKPLYPELNPTLDLLEERLGIK